VQIIFDGLEIINDVPLVHSLSTETLLFADNRQKKVCNQIRKLKTRSHLGYSKNPIVKLVYSKMAWNDNNRFDEIDNYMK